MLGGHPTRPMEIPAHVQLWSTARVVGCDRARVAPGTAALAVVQPASKTDPRAVAPARDAARQGAVPGTTGARSAGDELISRRCVINAQACALMSEDCVGTEIGPRLAVPRRQRADELAASESEARAGEERLTRPVVETLQRPNLARWFHTPTEALSAPRTDPTPSRSIPLRQVAAMIGAEVVVGSACNELCGCRSAVLAKRHDQPRLGQRGPACTVPAHEVADHRCVVPRTRDRGVQRRTRAIVVGK